VRDCQRLPRLTLAIRRSSSKREYHRRHNRQTHQHQQEHPPPKPLLALLERRDTIVDTARPGELDGLGTDWSRSGWDLLSGSLLTHPKAPQCAKSLAGSWPVLRSPANCQPAAPDNARSTTTRPSPEYDKGVTEPKNRSFNQNFPARCSTRSFLRSLTCPPSDSS